MIEFDLSSIVPESLAAYFSDDVLERLLDDLADGARAKWISLARRDLSATKQDYIAGIQPVKIESGARVLTLVGWLANAVEQGISGYDMRETLLGPNARNRKPVLAATVPGMPRVRTGDWYAHVPFRHGTPGSAGQTGAPMGRQYGPHSDASRAAGGFMEGGAAAEMGSAIHAAAKALKATRSHAGKRTSWGERLSPGTAGATLLRPPDPSHPNPAMRAGHRTDIFAGMVRVRHTYEKATQTQYRTWRTISTRVTDGWHHPGIEARGLARSVGEWIEETAPKLLQRFLRGLGDD